MPRKVKKTPEPKSRRADQRRHERLSIKARVDYELLSEDTFLFEYTSNVSRGGIFLATRNPLPVGTTLSLRFSLPGSEDKTIEVTGQVVWVNEFKPGGRNLNPGMGIEFIDLSPRDRETIDAAVGRKALLVD